MVDGPVLKLFLYFMMHKHDLLSQNYACNNNSLYEKLKKKENKFIIRKHKMQPLVILGAYEAI